eukprot:c16664_g1_i1.p1 GENE.c16664_g1_i1~~c16664_g1_i1.p1  ORF type:complete len:249 (+),score=49.68 c16664_g1_i1:16-762(+)
MDEERICSICLDVIKPITKLSSEQINDHNKDEDINSKQTNNMILPITQLSCGHKFHFACISQAFAAVQGEKFCCPNCRTPQPEISNHQSRVPTYQRRPIFAHSTFQIELPIPWIYSENFVVSDQNSSESSDSSDVPERFSRQFIRKLWQSGLFVEFAIHIFKAIFLRRFLVSDQYWSTVWSGKNPFKIIQLIFQCFIIYCQKMMNGHDFLSLCLALAYFLTDTFRDVQFMESVSFNAFIVFLRLPTRR